MAATLSVPESMVERVREFVRAEELSLEVVSSGEAAVDMSNTVFN